MVPTSVMDMLVKGRQRDSTHTGEDSLGKEQRSVCTEPRSRQRMLETQIFKVFGRHVPCSYLDFDTWMWAAL